MKSFLLFLITLTLLADSAHSVTIALTGRIQGRLNADWMERNLATMDFYFLEVATPTTLSVNWCVTAGPGGRFNTGVDLSLFPYVDPLDTLTRLAGVSDLGVCNQTSLIFPAAGLYLLSVSPRNGGFDGGDGVIPLTYSDSNFAWFDYNGSLEGNVALRAIWRGQADGTFAVTNVPEPSTAALAAAGAATCIVRRRPSLI